MESKIDALSKFEITADYAKFIDLFGERLGGHYWDKFTQNHVLRLWRNMDSDNRKILANHIKEIQDTFNSLIKPLDDETNT